MSSKVAIVTGSAGGLGKGIAERLVEDGFKVTLHDINQVLLEETVNEFKEKGYDVIGVTGDVSKKADQEHLVAETVAAFGRLDVMVNNAGIDTVTPFMEVTDEECAIQLSLEI